MRYLRSMDGLMLQSKNILTIAPTRDIQFLRGRIYDDNWCFDASMQENFKGAAEHRSRATLRK